MSLIGRLIVIVFAIMLACLATGMAIAAALLGPQWHVFSGDAGERVIFWGTAFFGTTFVGAAGLLPLAILIAIAESFKIRSMLAYAVAGAGLLLLGFYGSGLAHPTYEESIDYAPPPVSREAELAAAAGVVFGFTYWAIAGRKAGKWREPRNSVS